jgi:hypothetical protein
VYENNNNSQTVVIMEKQSTNPRIITFVIVISSVAISSLITFLIASHVTRVTCVPIQATAGRQSTEVEMDDTRDFVEKLKANGVTALRAVGVNKCFIMAGEQDFEHAANRVLTVLGTSMNHEQIDAIYGARIAEFCGTRDGYTVQLDHIVRSKRQAAASAASASSTAASVVASSPSANPVSAASTPSAAASSSPSPVSSQTAAAAQSGASAATAVPATHNVGEQGERAPNECQNQAVVICADSDVSPVVYKCNTGLNEVLHAQITCDKNNTFHFRLTRRCDKFKNTHHIRWIKCLSYFAQGPAKTGPQVEPDE